MSIPPSVRAQEARERQARINKARAIRNDLSGKIDGFEELTKTRSLNNEVGGSGPSQKALDLADGFYKFKDPVRKKGLTGIGSFEEREAAFSQEYPNLLPSQIEQIANISANKTQFAERLTAYDQIQQIALRDNLTDIANKPIDDNKELNEEQKKQLKKQNDSLVNDEIQKVLRGEKSVEEVKKDLESYVSNEYAKAAKFVHQNYLLVNSNEINKKLRDSKTYPPYKKTLVSRVDNSSGNPLGIYSSDKEQGSLLLNFKTQQLSLLVPHMRFYKIILQGNKRTKVEIPFPTVSLGYSQTGKIFKQSSDDKGRYFKNRDGFGIKSFEWQYNGTTEATKFTDLSANLSIYFQDFAQLTAIRDNNGNKFTYLDLIIPQEAVDLAQTGKSTAINQSDDAYIVAEVGWSVPPGSSLFTAEEIKAVQEHRLSMFLQQKNYELNFDADTTAAFTLNIEYHSAYELMAKNKNVNAILPSVRTCTLIKQKQDEIEDEKNKKTTGDEDKSGRIKKLNDEFEKIKENAAQESYKYIFRELLTTNRIHYIKADLAQILDFQGVDPNVTARILKSNKLTPLQQSNLNNDIKTWQEAPAGEDDKNLPEDIYFVYFGDLLELLILNATDTNKLKAIGYDINVSQTLRIMTTNIGFAGTELNIADIPIDVRLLANFFFEEVISRKSYSISLSEFVKNLLTKLMENKVEKFTENYTPTKNVYQTTYIDSQNDIVGLKEDKNILAKSFENSNKSTQFSYLSIYTAPKDGAEYSLEFPRNYKKSKEYDINERGIYHFVFGSQDSIVKSVTFKKSDIENLKEQRIFETQSPYAILANQFAVDIDMFGNTLFYPGRHVYINPAHSLGGKGRPWEEGSTYNIMGLGGYHQIKTVKSQISDGVFSTQIEADFISSGNKVKVNKRKQK